MVGPPKGEQVPLGGGTSATRIAVIWPPEKSMISSNISWIGVTYVSKSFPSPVMVVNLAKVCATTWESLFQIQPPESVGLANPLYLP